jgi:ribosomal protein L11 methyltransferase
MPVLSVRDIALNGSMKTGGPLGMPEETGLSHIRTPPQGDGWIEATIQFVHADDEVIGSFIGECIEFGARGGLEANSSSEAGVREEEHCEACGTSLSVRIYFPGTLGIREVVDILEKRTRTMRGTPHSPEARVRILRCRKIEQEEWATEWQGGFPPEKVSGRFWVVPPWQSPSLPEGALPLILEPGQAFGTGKHATTRHCLEFLEGLGEGGQWTPSFLDVGCGSGILSIAARRLGASRVVALEIDPDALDAAGRNLELNRLSGQVQFVNGTLTCCRATFDLIAANLDATTLLRQVRALYTALKQGGRVILSGMLTEEEPEVITVFTDAGLQPIARKEDIEEGWVSVLLEKP